MKIKGGYILLARKLLESNIMDKPPLHFKLWSWMLLQAKFKQNKNLERGQFQTSIKEMRDAMEYYVGYRKQRPSIKQIRSIYENLTRGTMIGTTKVTEGMVITILNYEEYQDPKNYEGHDEGINEIPTRGTPYNKERMIKNDILSGKSALLYFSPELINLEKTEVETTINGFISMRKTNKISAGVLEKEIIYWKNFPPEIINRSLIIYNKSKYWENGKGEKYLRGILRGKMNESEKQNSQTLSQKAF